MLSMNIDSASAALMAVLPTLSIVTQPSDVTILEVRCYI